MRHLTLQSLLVASSPRNSRESEGLCSSAGGQGAGPLVIAKRANQHKPRRDGEGWRREERNASQWMVPFLSPPNQTPMSSACNSGTGAYPLTTSSTGPLPLLSRSERILLQGSGRTINRYQA